MNGIEDVHLNNMSLHSSSRSKLTEFTFCNILDFDDNEKLYKDEHPFVSSPSFRPKIGYSDYKCSSLSTKARNKILEFMKNLPESSQELSLKDIVIDDIGKQRAVVDQASDLKTSLKDRKRIKRERTMSRSVSLDTGVFMLKMFNPVSCGMKKSKSSSSNKSNNRSTPPNTKSRSAESAPGCWFINKPWKSTSQRSCTV